MNFKCVFGFHGWEGCRCAKCGKLRDQDHDWTKNCETCTACGKSREKAHDWSGCRCRVCEKSRDEGHDWAADRQMCLRCGKPRFSEALLSGLFQSVREGDLGAVGELLKRNPDLVFAIDKEGATPLHAAVWSFAGHKDVAELLLANGADVNARARNGETPLHKVVGPSVSRNRRSSRRSSYELAELLLAHGAEVNAEDARGRTPLGSMMYRLIPELSENRPWSKEILLDEKHDFELAELLCRHGGKDTTTKTFYGTKLSWFVEFGLTEYVRAVLSVNPDLVFLKDDFGNTLLHLAVSTGSKDMTELVLSKNPEVNAKNHHLVTSLHLAMERGANEVAKLLLAKGADLGAKDSLGQTPLHNAARGNNRQGAEFLLDRGVDVNARANNGDTPVHMAACRRRKDVLELLLARGGEINLHDAAAIGDCTRAKEILKDNPRLVFAKDIDGWTPLHWAALHGNKEAVELLLANGANPRAEDNTGQMPWHKASGIGSDKDTLELLRQLGGGDIFEAARKADLKSVRAILENYPDLARVKDEDGDTPLHLAAASGTIGGHRSAFMDLERRMRGFELPAKRSYRDVVELLIANGSDVNASNNKGDTPLIVASFHDNKGVVELLLANNADVNAKTHTGWSSLRAAASEENKEIEELLLARGAKG